MKRKFLKPLSICLCAALAVSSVAITASALSGKQTHEPAAPATTSAADPQAEAVKDETVYVIAGADGSVEKIIVSDWLKNSLQSDSLSDESELLNVENVKGNESYQTDGDNVRVWDAQGNDIYYRGDIQKELPVDMRISYTLDGEQISPDALAGQSGHVVIRFDYQNNQFETVDIDGKKETIYVPFAMLTGILLDTDRFANVEVSNGKLINDGDHTAVIGLAFPGLQSNLGVAKETLNLPDYVEISADVTDFEMANTLTVATNSLFSQLDTAKLSSADSLSESLGQLTDALTKLTDGSSTLYDGLCTLLEKSNTLVSGVDQLATGAESLKNGAGAINSGASQLQQGAAALSSGLDTLRANNDSLNGGARQVFNSLLATANSQIAATGLSIPALTIDNYADTLNSAITSLDENAVYQAALAQVTAAVEANRPTIQQKVTAAVKEQVTAQVTAAVQEQVTAQVTAAVREAVAAQVIPVATNGAMTKESYDAAVAAGAIDAETQTAIEAAIDAQMATDEVALRIAQNTAAQMKTDAVQQTIAANVNAQMQTQAVKDTIAANVETQVQKAISENMASDAVQSQLQAASEGAKSLIALKASLDSYNSFYLGLRSYTAGVADAAAGASELKSGAGSLQSGAAQLQQGAGSLYDGIQKVKDGTPALLSGITQLCDGAMTLRDGLKDFKEQGVQKLLDAFGDNLDGLAARVSATVEVSRHYQSFAGISEDMNGEVKFIYRTDAIKNED